MMVIELTNVFCAPPVKTVEPLIEWGHFWLYFISEIDNLELYEQLSIANWLLENMAFANDGVRLIENRN